MTSIVSSVEEHSMLELRKDDRMLMLLSGYPALNFGPDQALRERPPPLGLKR